MSEHQLITARRNFLIRALGFTAAGDTMPIPIVTLADAKSQIDHHKAGLMAAWSVTMPARNALFTAMILSRTMLSMDPAEALVSSLRDCPQDLIRDLRPAG
jgi:hypothetical protein